MTDNVVADAGAGGATFATDDVGGVHYPRSKVVWGADGAVNDTSAAAPMPVVQTGALPAGTNGIGKLTANSGVDIGDVDVTSVPAPLSTTGTGTEATALRVTVATDSTGVLSVDDNGASLTVDIAATASNIGAQLSTSAIMNGTTAIAPAFAVIDAASSGDNTLVSADATKKIRVLSLFLVSAGTVNVRFEGGAGGTALTGQMNLVANSGFVLPFNPVGWFETAANTLLNLELSGAISVDGSLTYVLV